MEKLKRFLNPIATFGEKNYSVIFPFLLTFSAAVFLEVYSYLIIRDPNAVGIFAIFVFIALIIYFSFRDGIRGGLTTTFITVAYYAYIIYTRNHTGDQLTSSVQTTITLGLVYIFLALVIGWLRQTIDNLIEREANEKNRLQAIVQQLPVGVIVTDDKGRITLTNKRADMILGTKVPLGFQVGNEFFVKITDSKPLPSNRSILAATLESGRPYTNEEFTVEKENGKRVFIQASASPIKNKAGKIIAAAEILTDVTEQKELEIRKDDFVNMASHELKTPITSMKLYVDSLLKRVQTSKDPSVIKILTSVKYQTERLQALVNDLLDVSRINTGKLALNKENFYLDKLISETIEALEVLTSKRIIFNSPKTHITVFADRYRTYQVVTNLINNALKYSGDSTEVRIKLKKQDDKAVVSVQDFGIGIAKENVKKIFEKLYQVTERKEKTFPGLGMGLFITREIIKRHRGNVWVESELGKGSTFYFTLPLSAKK